MHIPLLSVSEAKKIILEHARPFESEKVPLRETQGRVAAANIFADRDYPPFNRAAVDGFAVNSQYINTDNPLAIAGEVLAGSFWHGEPCPEKAIRVMTGAPVPPFMDTMIPVEKTAINDHAVSFLSAVIKKGQNIALKGEDLTAGREIPIKGRIIQWLEYAALAALGIRQLSVFRLPVVRIVSTGNEIKSADSAVSDYQIRDSNAYSIEGFLRKYSIIPDSVTHVPDDLQQLQLTFNNQQSDILIVSGGVSMGEADFVPKALEQAGYKCLFHKVAIKPGKPLWVGTKGRSIAFALPGNPVSVQVALKIFVEPYIRKSFLAEEQTCIVLPLDIERTKKSDMTEYFPVRISDHKNGLIPCHSNGSGDIRVTMFSHGIALHPVQTPYLSAGTPVRFYPW